MRKNLSLLTCLITMTGATYTQAEIPLVFGTTYVSTGANAELGGDIVANTYLVVGASTTVNGNIQTGTAITLGAGSTVGDDDIKDTISGTATTLGASTIVSGNVQHVTVLTLGASAEIGGDIPISTAPVMPYKSGQVDTAQRYYNGLTAPLENDRNILASTMPNNITLDPYNQYARADDGIVVYNATSLTTGAGITLTLVGDYDFVFNIVDMLSIGAGTIMIVGDDVRSVTWNMGGYASVGAQAEMIGTVFAGGYISTGVDSVITGANAPSVFGESEETEGVSYSGGLFSATSYVTVGASGTVKGVTAVEEF